MKRNNKGTSQTIRIKVRKNTPDHALTKAFDDMHHKVKRGHCKHKKQLCEVDYAYSDNC